MFHSKRDAVKPAIRVFDQVNHIPKRKRTADAQPVSYILLLAVDYHHKIVFKSAMFL